jgi:hypothetical protein
MSAHTPTPWFKNSKFEIGPRPRTDDQHDGMLHPVADVFGDNREANAAFIVKAVNRDHHFEALVKALEKARTRIEYLGAACQNPKHFEANAETFLPAIDEVLAAAGRGQ